MAASTVWLDKGDQARGLSVVFKSVISVSCLLLLSCAVAAGPVRAADATPAPLPFVLSNVGPGVYAAIDGPEGRSGSNAGFIIGDDGVAVVDAFFNPEAARALLAEIRKLTPLPVRYVINTHYHADHVGGDAVFREAGAVIIAQRNVRGWVRTENLNLLGGPAIKPANRALVEGLALPDLGVDQHMTLWLGGRRVEVRKVLGHTGGDLVVEAPDAHVLFCGDMLWRRVSPNVVDGTVSDWIASVAAFASAPDAAVTRFVPGHGDVASLDDVKAFGGYLQRLSAETVAGRQAGLKGEALVAAVLPKLKAAYGGWAAFDYFAPKEIAFMDAELAGTKRRPIPQP